MKSELNEIISRIIVDEGFRAAFLADPIKATEEYSLSEEQIAELKTINLDEITSVNRELEERISKSFISLPDVAEDDDKWSQGTTTHTQTHSSGW